MRYKHSPSWTQAFGRTDLVESPELLQEHARRLKAHSPTNAPEFGLAATAQPIGFVRLDQESAPGALISSDELRRGTAQGYGTKAAGKPWS
jgi:hypothetical protein